MATLPPAAATIFMRYLFAVQEAVQSGTTLDACQQRMYQHWADLCSTFSVVPNLQDSSLSRDEILQVYGHRVRHAHYSKRCMDRLGKESVSQSWGEIAVTHLLDGLPDPRNPPDTQAHTKLDRHLARQFKTYGLDNPLVKQEKAVPLDIIHSIVAAESFSSNPKIRQVSVLVTLGFYFCLQLCEYTKCTRHCIKFQFCTLVDFFFFGGGQLLPDDAPIEHFQLDTQIILTLDNQKNVIRVELVSHF